MAKKSEAEQPEPEEAVCHISLIGIIYKVNGFYIFHSHTYLLYNESNLIEEDDAMNLYIKQLFDSNASHYDPERRQLIPCFDDFYGMALSLVESDNPAPRILDLGAGTGLFSAMVLQKYPDAHLTLVDLSDKMMEAAQARFHQNPNIEYIVADYTAYDFQGPYDFVISSLSIHHLTHPLKQQLFFRIHHLLQDGAHLLMPTRPRATRHRQMPITANAG